MNIMLDNVVFEKMGFCYKASVRFSDGVIAHPTIYGCDIDTLKVYIEDYYLDEIYKQATDQENNYGLLFYACGYNGSLQTEYKMQADYDGITII